ncbi:MAG: inositol monophosphatase [Candidatus Bathyarchaeota archaeon]|nr:inositol monophosphatase [Candidatus Bathyarchaeota archaeon]
MKELAFLAAKDAGRILMKNFGKKGKVRMKLEGELVTDSDVKSEERIIDLIREKYPDHSILAEEHGFLKGNPDYTWIIDPMDGTHNFINKLPLFGVSIALEHKKEVVLGVVYLPCFDDLYVAEKGKGAYLNGARITVSKKTLKESLLLYESQFRKTGKLAMMPFSVLTSSVSAVRIFGSASVSLTLIASGKAEAYITYNCKPVDIAGGSVILEEAGGIVTGLKGTSWNPYMEKVVATNGKIHEEVLKILRRTHPKSSDREI